MRQVKIISNYQVEWQALVTHSVFYVLSAMTIKKKKVDNDNEAYHTFEKRKKNEENMEDKTYDSRVMTNVIRETSLLLNDMSGVRRKCQLLTLPLMHKYTWNTS